MTIYYVDFVDVVGPFSSPYIFSESTTTLDQHIYIADSSQYDEVIMHSSSHFIILFFTVVRDGCSLRRAGIPLCTLPHNHIQNIFCCLLPFSEHSHKLHLPQYQEACDSEQLGPGPRIAELSTDAYHRPICSNELLSAHARNSFIDQIWNEQSKKRVHLIICLVVQGRPVKRSGRFGHHYPQPAGRATRRGYGLA